MVAIRIDTHSLTPPLWRNLLPIVAPTNHGPIAEWLAQQEIDRLPLRTRKKGRNRTRPLSFSYGQYSSSIAPCTVCTTRAAKVCRKRVVVTLIQREVSQFAIFNDVLIKEAVQRSKLCNSQRGKVAFRI